MKAIDDFRNFSKMNIGTILLQRMRNNYQFGGLKAPRRRAKQATLAVPSISRYEFVRVLPSFAKVYSPRCTHDVRFGS